MVYRCHERCTRIWLCLSRRSFLKQSCLEWCTTEGESPVNGLLRWNVSASSQLAMCLTPHVIGWVVLLGIAAQIARCALRQSEYRHKTDSAQVEWSNGEKYSAKRVKSTWSGRRQSGCVKILHGVKLRSGAIFLWQPRRALWSFVCDGKIRSGLLFLLFFVSQGYNVLRTSDLGETLSFSQTLKKEMGARWLRDSV